MTTYFASNAYGRWVATQIFYVLVLILLFPGITSAATAQSNYQPQTLEELIAYLHGIIAQLEAQIAAQEGGQVGTVVRPGGQSVTTIKTLSPTNVDDNSATLRGEVDFATSATVRVWFEYGRTTSFGSRTTAVSVTGRANTFATVTRTVTGLRDSERYFVRLVVELPNGTRRYGDTERFTADDSDDSFDDWDDDFDRDSDGSLTVSNRSMRAGETVRVSFSVDSDDRSSTNWIGVYRQGAGDQNYLTYQYITNDSRGTNEFTLSAAGEYQFRLFKNNGYTRIAVSPIVTVR